MSSRLQPKANRVTEESCGSATRRDFLKGATSVAAGVIAAHAVAAEENHSPIPAVALGPSRVTRLIVGGNPLYGYSHFNGQYSLHMLEWFTDERVVKLLLDCEKAGINTFAYQNIKPIDAAIVGMYPRYSDQIGENTRIVSEILKA